MDMPASPFSARSLDRQDQRIVEALMHDARQSLSGIGRRIGLSQPAVSERVRRLEESGVIRGYTARVDPQAIGIALEAIIRVKTGFDPALACLEMLRKTPQVLDAWKVTGEDSFFLRCAFAQPREMHAVIDMLSQQGAVNTSIVLSHPVSRPPAFRPG